MKRKRINKTKVTIAIILVLLLLLGITIGLYYLINGKKEPVEHLLYDEFEMIGGKIDDHTYYLLGASNDVSFDVIKEANFSYQITDNEGDAIEGRINENTPAKIKGPATLYEEGKTYHLKIENGSFVDEKYKDITEIIFKINRPSKQEITLNDKVIKVNKDNALITDKELTLNGEYKENDIIVIYDDDKLISAYKIAGGENGKYTYSVPKLNEIFSDIDYYGKERINLSGYQNDKDINLLLAKFIPTVYAKEDVTISKPVWNKKDGTLEVGIAIYTNEKKEFLVNHDAKVELTLVLSVDLYKDITLNEVNYVTVINYDIKAKNNLNHVNNNYIKLYDSVKLKDTIENYDTDWLVNNYNDLSIDKKEITKSLGKITVATEVPGLYMNVDLGTFLSLNSNGFINNLLTGKSTLVVGINNDKLYTDYTFDNKIDLNFMGDEKNEIAGIINTKLNFMNIFNMDTNILAGLYSDGKSTMKVNTEDKKQTKINYEVTGDSGYIAKYIVNVMDEEKKIYDDKTSLANYERKVKISSKIKEEEEKPQEEVTYKHSAEEVRELLQNGYDALDALEEWSSPIGTLTVHGSYQKTINTENNTFTGTWNFDSTASYTCTYNYVTGAMSCDGFSSAKDYVKGTCDSMHDDYLNYLETGEIENGDAIEWDNLYSSIEACYYEAIPENEPSNFKEDIQKILNQVDLTFDDLGVLNS